MSIVLEGMRRGASFIPEPRINIRSTRVEAGPNQEIYYLISSHVIKRSHGYQEKAHFLCQTDRFDTWPCLPLTSYVKMGFYFTSLRLVSSSVMFIRIITNNVCKILAIVGPQ